MVFLILKLIFADKLSGGELMFFPEKEEFLKLSQEKNLIPVYKEIVADMETPVSIFKRFKDEQYSYLLESVEQGQKIGRYSFIGVDYQGIIEYQNGKLIRKNKEGKEIKSIETEQPLAELADVLAEYQAYEVDDLPIFYGGAVGYLGYDMISYFEPVPKAENDDLELPDMLFILSDTILVFDHLHHSIKVVSNARIGDNPKADYQQAVDKIDETIEKLSKAPEAEVKVAVDRSLDDELKPGVDFKSNLSKEEFVAMVEETKEHIYQGDIFQAVLSQRLETETEAEGFSIYRKLRSLNPSPYMYYLNFADFEIVGSSPELLVRVEDGVVENRPIAGTRKRGTDEAEDQELAEDMLNDEKERAEHIMLVDLGRNDVGRVSEYGTVEVNELMNVEYYSHVMHLVSNVKGELKDDKDIYQALKSCFPAGTVSGAPKIKAMEIVNRLEPTKRGPYAGSIGYFGYSGNLDSCITIRTILLKDKTAYVQAGAGIVHDSKPELEYEETLNKARALLKAVKLAGDGEKK